MTELAKIKKWNGKPIAMPGIYSGVPISFYHSAEAAIEPSMSSSGLRTIFKESPRHYWSGSVYNPDRIELEETNSLILGRAAHHLLFGEADFRKLFTVRPATVNGEAWHGNKTICKMWLQKQEDVGLTVLTMPQLDQIKGMAKSLAEEPLVRAGILNGGIEQSYIWKDIETGVWLKSRPDANPNDGLDFCDMKTTTSVQLDDLRRTIADYGYHQQGALIGEACQQIHHQPMNSFSLLFIESKPPYCCRIVTLKANDLQLGHEANHAALQTFAICLKAKHWPGPGGDQQDAAYIEMQPYAQRRVARQLGWDEDRIKRELGDGQ
jgi:hypothetical protein